MKRFLDRTLGHASFPFIAALLAVLLVLPSLWSGLQQDDLTQRLFLHGYADTTGQQKPSLAIFTFLTGDTTLARFVMDTGIAPWWTLPALRISFWRPLAALDHYLDYVLWPEQPMLMHMHSLLWFAAMIIAGVYMYRRYLGPTVTAGMAGLLFALDDVHGLAAGWIANRNTLITLLAGTLLLIVHDRWRRDGWNPGWILGPLLLGAGLFAGESALAICGYLFSYAIFLDHGTVRRRIRSLLPYVVLTVMWLIARDQRGHGTWGSGYYIDPLSEPLRFLEAVGMRFPVLLADQLFLPPSSLVLFIGEHPLSPVLIWGVVIVSLFGFLLWPLIRTDRVSRFWVAGMLLSVPIVCTTLPHSRLLMFVGIGACGLLGTWMQRAREKGIVPGEPRTHTRLRKWALIMLVGVHIPLAVVSLIYNATSPTFAQKYIQDPALGLAGGEELKKTDLMIVTHPIPFYAHQTGVARLVLGEVPPRRLRVLAPGNDSVHIQRPDSVTLLVRPEGGFIGGAFDNVFRGPAHPMVVGEQVRLTGMTVEILALTEDGRPAEARFTFGSRLEDPAFRWVCWANHAYVPFTLPPVGGSVDLTGSPIEF
jgi:hypothetical protein